VARLDRELARLARMTHIQTPEEVAERLEALLPEWRAALASTRQVLRKLLQGRVVMTPEVRDERPGYRVRGAASVEPLLNVVIGRTGEVENGAQEMASPAGFEPAFWP
jgi:hypothetical protein